MAANGGARFLGRRAFFKLLPRLGQMRQFTRLSLCGRSLVMITDIICNAFGHICISRVNHVTSEEGDVNSSSSSSSEGKGKRKVIPLQARCGPEGG